MTREKAAANLPPQLAGHADGQGGPAAHGKDIEERVTQLEAWAEAAMRALSSLASIDLEALLTELDQARGVDYGDWPGPAE